TRYETPGGFGVRVDSGVREGSQISPFYDSMVAKLMTWGRDRTEAIQRMRRALGEFRVEGIQTTIPMHQLLMDDPQFQEGRIHINFLERRLESLQG
ncbi:protein containing Biotin carboxylase, partial [mine drainage metagenome]